MSRRSAIQSLAASPTMVGAVTVLIAIVAVFLAYNANNGLPFVPVYRVSVEVPNAARLTTNNEVRIGGHRVGVVESIEPVQPRRRHDRRQRRDRRGRRRRTTPAACSALVNLKLDKTAQPLPQDSIFRVRYQSAFGLKYLEVVRGNGDAGARGLHLRRHRRRRRLPPARETADEPPGSGRRRQRLLPGADRVRRHRQHLRHRDPRERAPQPRPGFGDAFAGRGFSLNHGDREPAPADREPEAGRRRPRSSRPRGSPGSSPSSATPRASSPRSPRSRPSCSRSWRPRSPRSPPTPRRSRRRSREGVADARRPGSRRCRGRSRSCATSPRSPRALRPGVADLRITLPTLNDAIDVGTPGAERLGGPQQPASRASCASCWSWSSSRPPGPRCCASRTPSTSPSRSPAGWCPRRPTATTGTTGSRSCRTRSPTESTIGYTFRQALTNYPLGARRASPARTATRRHRRARPRRRWPATRASSPTARSARTAAARSAASPTQPDDFAPYKLPITYGPVYGPAGQNLPGQDFDDCQAGQTGYPLGRCSCPGQATSNPAIGVADLPGSRGPTTLFWNQDSTRELRDTRVDSRQPQTWDGLP